MPPTTATITLITGANQGIGFSLARALASAPHNHHVFLGSRSSERGIEAASQLQKEGLNVQSITIDVTADSTIHAAADLIASQCGRLDVLVNNAGIALDMKQSGGSVRGAFQETFNCNVFGSAITTEIFTPLLSKSVDPRVVFMSSSLGSLGKMIVDANSPFLTYRSSKTAMNMVMKTFAEIHKKDGWKVNSACPGHTKTALNAFSAKGTVEDGTIEAVRLATGEDVGTGSFSNKEGVLLW